MLILGVRPKMFWGSGEVLLPSGRSALCFWFCFVFAEIKPRAVSSMFLQSDTHGPEVFAVFNGSASQQDPLRLRLGSVVFELKDSSLGTNHAVHGF